MNCKEKLKQEDVNRKMRIGRCVIRKCGIRHKQIQNKTANGGAISRFEGSINN